MYKENTAYNRFCIKCKEVKSLNSINFIPDSTRKSGYRYTCRQCTLIYRKTSSFRRRSRLSEIYKHCKKFDSIKNLYFNLTPDYIQKQLNLVCTYCGYPSIGLDRVDNKKGHSMDNCVPCCTECNVARMDNFSTDEMLIIGKAIKEVKNNRNLQNNLLTQVKQLITF